MPKMKTNKSAAKRFKKTATGKFKHGKANKQKLLGHKSMTRKRRLRQSSVVSKSDEKRLRRLLPYA